MSESIELHRLVSVPADHAVRVFWDIADWYRVWDRISEVEVRYDDGVHQEFAMEVERDGRMEQVRTLRFLTGDGDIEFVSPDPPPSMTFHQGAWRFTPEGDGCRLTAARRYELAREPGEDEAAYRERSAAYRERFARRLGLILDCFRGHFAKEAEGADDMITCLASVEIARTPQRVGEYLAKVGNLPEWTGFFRQVGPSVDGRRHPVETLMGSAVTWIDRSAEADGVLVRTINSLIAEREEQAVLRLCPDPEGDATTVRFTVRLPAGAPPERVAGQQAAMTDELGRLKELLERVS